MISDSDVLGASILIVDDQETNVILLQQLLADAGYTNVDSTMDPMTVCAMHRKNAYDLILLDLQMPEMDGYQATAEIRKLPGQKYAELPIIALTASATLDIKDIAFAVGMNDYISKPFNPTDLYNKIAALRKYRGVTD